MKTLAALFVLFVFANPAIASGSAHPGLPIQSIPKGYTLAVISDSTADGTTEWPHLLTQEAAKDFPGRDVIYRNYNRTTRNWTLTTIQTGVNPAIVVYNASCSGWSVDTWRQEITQMGLPHVFPITPDQILISLGHNSPTLDGPTYELHLQALLALLPITSEITLVTQNPQRPNPMSAGQHERMNYVRLLAIEQGLGLIDVEVFLFQHTDWLWMDPPPQFIHPNAIGEILWEGRVAQDLLP